MPQTKFAHFKAKQGTCDFDEDSFDEGPEFWVVVVWLGEGELGDAGGAVAVVSWGPRGGDELVHVLEVLPQLRSQHHVDDVRTDLGIILRLQLSESSSYQKTVWCCTLKSV